MKTVSNKLAEFIKYLSGEELPIEHKTFVLVVMANMVLSFVGFLSNLSLGLPILTDVVLLINIAVNAACIAYTFTTRRWNGASVFVAGFTTLVLLPLIWFSSNGAAGSTISYAALSSLMIVVLFKGRLRIAFFTTVLLIYCGFIVYEMRYPEVAKFELNRNFWYIDLLLGLAMSFIICAVLAYVVTNNYEQYVRMENLREADARRRIMIDASPFCTHIWNNKLELIDCNQATVDLFKLNDKYEYLKNFNDYSPEYQPDGRLSREAAVAYVRDAFDNGRVRAEWTHRATDGELIPSEMFLVRLDYRDESVVVAYIRDAREQRRMIMEVESAQSTISAMFESNPYINILFDSGFRVVDCNPAAVGFMGFGSKEELHAGFVERMTNSIPAFQSDGRPSIPLIDRLTTAARDGYVNFETEFIIGGKTLSLNVEFKRIPYEKSFAIVGYVLDMTGVHEHERELEKKRTEAEAANKAKSTFLSNMSHEMRTPMNAIIGMTAIGKAAASNERKDDAFNKIEGASNHLLGVINDVLDMSKIEADKLVLSPVGFEFEKMLQKAVNVINFLVEERRQKFSVEIDEKIPRVLIGDDQRILQVVTNLLSNAVKFTPDEGSIRLKARLLSERNDHCVVSISVADTGIGITDDQKARMFRSFEQAEADTTRRFGGTGLGLAISKRIAELMNGELEVESEPGVGSEFFFTVALRRGELNLNIFADGAERGEAGPPESFAGHCVLLAEDVEINREIVLALLEPTGLTIDCAENGAQAVRMFERAPERYEMIFMDVQMPELDGYQATREIRALGLPGAKTVPIVAMTANVFREDVEKCLAAGMNGHVGKPIKFEEVLGQLRTYIVTGAGRES